MANTQLINKIVTYGIQNKKSKNDIMLALLNTGEVDPVNAANYVKTLGDSGALDYQGTQDKQPDLSGASALERQSVADIDSTIQMSREAKTMMNGIATGPMAGRVQGAKQMLPGGGDESFNKLDAKLSNIKSNFMKALSGAAVSEQEVARLSKFLPSVNDQEEVIKIKLEALESELSNRKKNTLKSLGIEVPEETTQTDQPVPGFQEAMDFARQNPNDPNSQKLITMLRSGEIDPITGQKKTVEMKTPETQTEQPTENQGFFGAIGQGFKNIGNSIKESGKGVSDILDKNISKTSKVAGVFGQFLKPFTQIATEAVATPLRAGGELVEKGTGYDINTAVKSKLEEAVKAGMDTEEAKTAMQWWEKLNKENPEAATVVGGLLNAVDFATVGLGAGKAVGAVKPAAKTVGKSAVKTAEIAGKGVAKTGQGIGSIGKTATSLGTGMERSTIEQIIKTPGAFSSKEIAKIDRESLFSKVKGGVEKRLEDLSETGKGYDEIRKQPNRANVSENTIIDKLKSKGIQVEDGKIKVDLGSDIQLSKADAKGLEEVMTLIKGKKDLSATEVLNLRKRLSNLSAYGEGKTDASKIVAREIRSAVDEIAKKEIPGLADLDAKFSPEIKEMRKIKKEIFNADGSVKDNAISKIANLTGKGKEQALSRMEKIIPNIREDVNILKAIEDIEVAKGQKVGTYLRGAAGGFAVTGGNPIGAVAAAILSSPQIAVPLIRTYGKAKNISSNIVNGMIGKMKKGVKLIGEEKKIMDEAVDNASKKTIERMKKIRPGMNIQETSEALKNAIQHTEESIRAAKAKGLSENSPQVKVLIKELSRLRNK